MNIHLACNLYHEPGLISDPLPGSTHDAAALQATGLLEYFANSQARIIGDRDYIGCADITPVRKPPGGTLTEHDKTYNRSVNHIRWAIEAVIAHLKGFKCLAHRYRRPYPTFRTTLSTIIGLFFFKRYE